MVNRLEASGSIQAKTHIGQLVQDVGDFNFRADGWREAAGSTVMAPAHGITKAGNAFAKDIGNLLAGDEGRIAPEPLDGGPFMHLRRDVPSIIGNTGKAIGNLVTLHPIRAVGNGINVAADAFDLAVVDPALDTGNLIFGHENRKTQSGYYEHELN